MDKKSKIKEDDLNRELHWKMKDFLRSKSEPERIEFNKEVWDSIKEDIDKDEMKNLSEKIGKDKANDMLYRKHKKDHFKKIFDTKYEGVTEILKKEIKDGGHY